MEKLRASEVRSWLFGAVIFCFLLASWEVVLRSQQRPEAPPIHIEVKQVLVPVIVTDRKGRYIGNLTAQDFRVFDDGVRQKIVAFSGNAGAAANYFEPQPVEAGLQLPRRLSSMRERNAIPHNTFIICLDTVDSAFSNYAHVRLALEKLFKGEQASDADYALIALGRDVKVIRNFTRDPASILAALDEREFTHAVTESEAPRQAQEETELAGMLSRYCQQCDCTSGHNPSSPDNPCQMQWEAIAEWAAAQAESRRRITRDFLVNLRGLVKRLGEAPGRRTVVLVSDGFNMQPGREFYGLMAAYTRAQGVFILNATENVGPELEEVVRAAQRRDVSFYTLDSRGVYIVPATGLDINQPVVAPFPGQNTGSRMGVTLANTYSGQQTVASEKQAGLAELASATGGIFFHNSNDFLKGFRQALEDGKSYYLLAYIPTP